jgi:hypothetical protein
LKLSEHTFIDKLRMLGVEEVAVAQKTIEWAGKWMSPINPWSGKQIITFRPNLDCNGFTCMPVALYASPEGLMIGVKSMRKVPIFRDNIPKMIDNIRPFADDKIVSDDLRIRWPELKDDKNFWRILEAIDWVIKDRDVNYSELSLRIKHQTSKEGVLPNKDDFESAYRMLSSPGKEIDKNSILDQIYKNAIKSGYNLKPNWRLITERNIEIWVKEK